MSEKMRSRFEFLRQMRTGTLEPAIQQALEREEDTGAKALLYFRIVMFAFFLFGGITSAPDLRDVLTNVLFALGYGVFVALQWYLSWRHLHRALHRYAYFMVLADHALFAGMLVFYFAFYGNGNFNHAMKSPYMVLLVMPTLMTLVQFRYTLLFFSLSVVVTIMLGFYGYALLSGVPRTTNWQQYILGDALIGSAWLGLWLLLPLLVATLVGYAIFRSIRMVSQIGKIEGQKKQMSRYFSPAVVEEISNQKDYALTKGERRAVAVLFADIRSFTSLSENMAPDKVADMLSELRQLQIRAVFANGGMVDKFIGDAIMAVFGAPRSAGSFVEDVNSAVRCGIAMHRALKDFNQLRTARGENPIRIGIGIHAGEAFAGNLGGEGQLEYTVIGDVVNTASRIEHLCKKAQADFLVSETVALELRNAVPHEKIGLVRIRGREKPMGIHKILHEAL